MADDEVLVVCKTHLDIGFTDLAATVRDRYIHELMPTALATARRLRQGSDGDVRLVWTVGSWLVVEALERTDAEGRRLIEAGIEAGDLAWHALPCTTHTELADPSLIRYGLSLAARLDERYGRRTVAAKMTDVPGHTRGLVPLLAEAGVRLLHLGVNPASTPPDVPPVFRWLDRRSGTEVVVVYQRGGYGGAVDLAGSGSVLVVEHTGDNEGPPTAEAVRSVWERLAAAHPGATIRAARLDDAWHALERAGGVDALPVVDGELADTWIHGAGSDPRKVARFRALARVREAALADGRLHAADPAVERASRALLLVAEHTWGLDEKVHLADTTRYRTAEVIEARAADPRFQHMERSWAEQQAYVDEAAAALAGTAVAGEAAAALAATEPARPSLEGLAPVAAGGEVQGQHLAIAVDPVTGALITCRTAEGRNLAGRSHPIGRFRYQTFSAADYDRWVDEYVVAEPQDEWWARLDQAKPGIEAVAPVSQWWQPTVVAAHAGRIDGDRPGTRLVVALRGPTEAVERYGCPAEIVLTYDLPDEEPAVHLDVSWFGKRPCRLPEASWLVLRPKVADAGGWRLDKLGQPVSPWEVVPDGGRALHGVGRGFAYDGPDGPLTVEVLDSPLVAPGRPALLRHRRDHVPDVAGHGFGVGLHNNVWGTNFRMWCDDDARFRFVLRPSPSRWW